MCCGTEDSLISTNREFIEYLKALGIAVCFEEGPGAHEWDFWNRYTKRVLDWLPLEEIRI